MAGGAQARRNNIVAKNMGSRKRASIDENSNPSIGSSNSRATRRVNLRRSPLSPLSEANIPLVINGTPRHTGMFDVRTHDSGVARAKRKTIIVNKNTMRQRTVTGNSTSVNANVPSYTTPLINNFCNTPLSTISYVGNTPTSTHQSNGLIGSEVLNPTRNNLPHKIRPHSSNAMHSIPFTRLDFENESLDDSDQSHSSSSGQLDDEYNPQLQSLLYEKAERQLCLDVGDPSLCCKKCKSQMWFGERSEIRMTINNAEFSLCCMKGKVQLDFLKRPPNLLLNLYNGNDHRSSHFLDNIRAYNSMFSFTSMGGKVERSINDGGGPPQFIISGQNFHRMGSLKPETGRAPKFAQLYIYDTKNESSNRVSHFSSHDNSNPFDISLVEDLKNMIDNHNKLVQSFRQVRDHVEQGLDPNFCVRLFRHRSKDARMHNIPDCDEVAALIIGDLNNIEKGRDIIVKNVSGEFERLQETHTSFIPLQYPLLFPYGEDGYREDIKPRDEENSGRIRKRQRISIREWIAFRIMDRQVEYGNVVNSMRLFQQFVVDCYTMIESERLNYIRLNQSTIRCDLLNGLQEALSRGETDGNSVGKKVILPSSFTGSTRYMFNNCQDAMAVCKRFGYPDLFIIITCNSNWREIQDFLSPRHLTASDRPDIVCRVFKMKLDQLMADFKKEELFRMHQR